MTNKASGGGPWTPSLALTGFDRQQGEQCGILNTSCEYVYVCRRFKRATKGEREGAMTTAPELKTQILTKSEEDGDFRSRPIAGPKAAILSEIGTVIPGGLGTAAHEDSAATAHLVLPPSAELTEANLERPQPAASRISQTGQRGDAAKA